MLGKPATVHRFVSIMYYIVFVYIVLKAVAVIVIGGGEPSG